MGIFAHQVIEDKKKYFSMEFIESESDYDGKKVIFKNPPIEGSQYFHMGEYSAIRKITGVKLHEPLDLKEHIKYLKLPFRRTWIDCFNAPNKNFDYKNIPDHPSGIPYELGFCDKYGILIIESGTGMWAILSYFHYKKYNQWRMAPMVVFLTFKQVDVELRVGWLNIYGDQPTKMQRDGIINETLGDILAIVVSSIKLLNCKNIETINNYPPKKLNEARRRKGKQELFTYKTLQIKLPGTKQVRGENQPTGEHNRIHFCRGHFKEYTEEHPLFGKVTGLYWWQPHVRGQNREGVVLKDYRIKPMAQPEIRA